MSKKRIGAALAITALFAAPPATMAAFSQSGTIKGAYWASAFDTSCRPGGVLVGINGTAGKYVDSVQPVCVHTTGALWTTATYTGTPTGNTGSAGFSRVCPANTVVKQISGKAWTSLDQITIACQGLNDAGEFTGPITTLAPAGGYGGYPKGAVACSLDQPASGIYGTYGQNLPGSYLWGSSLHSIGLNCASRMEGLKLVSTPTPSTLGDYVADRGVAIALGKALFWDMQVGSDGVQACASCHFHAGADNRSKNQLNPGLNRVNSAKAGDPDTTFQVGGPNHQLTPADYPFFQRTRPDDTYSAIVRSVNDITSSQGVFLTKFLSATPGQSKDGTQNVADPIFKVGGLNTRRVEPRNTPTMINAVFNFRNFWDGRAQYIFNGVNPFGARDANARVFKNAGGIQAVQVRIDHASLASQAVGPPGSIFEMSADGRSLMDVGKRLLAARPLAQQQVHPSDSVLGPYAVAGGKGLAVDNYAQAIQAAFRPEWWNGTQAIEVDAAGNKKIIAMPAVLAANQYTQMQANFSLFFGLAIQLYESTLVSNDSPYDRYMAGDSNALTADQKSGLMLFQGKGKCANCHGGAEFTNASVRKTLNEPLQRMVMGNGGVAVYDEGFYNTAVTPTTDDLLNGGLDPFGNGLSNTFIAQKFGSAGFQQIIGISPNITVSPYERIAVNGAAKTSTVRNAELTQPFFHNGGALTLMHVMEFYNRGGNFKNNNIADVDPDIQPLGLSLTEKQQLIAFVKSLTDDRVRRDAAPFDHPELMVPNGHPGGEASVSAADGRAADQLMTIPAVGAGGQAGQSSPNFLGVVE